MAQILHATLNQHPRDSGIPHESASRAFGITYSMTTGISPLARIIAKTLRDVPHFGLW
jgi:hypothetical protein